MGNLGSEENPFYGFCANFDDTIETQCSPCFGELFPLEHHELDMQNVPTNDSLETPALPCPEPEPAAEVCLTLTQYVPDKKCARLGRYEAIRGKHPSESGHN